VGRKTHYQIHSIELSVCETENEASKEPPNKKRNSQCGHFLQKNFLVKVCKI